LTYRTANLQSSILYIYSTNIGTEYFKHGVCSPLFPLQNAVCFIILSYLVHVLFEFYIQGVLKLKKNSGSKRLRHKTMCVNSMAVSYRKYINNCPTRCKTNQAIYYSASSLYTFRVSTTPIIRSTQNCNYSLRYWSYFFVQLPPSNVAKLAWL